MRRHVVNNYSVGPNDGARSDVDGAEEFRTYSDKAVVFNHRHSVPGGTTGADRDLLCDVHFSADAAVGMNDHPHPSITEFRAFPNLRRHGYRRVVNKIDQVINEP